MHSRPRSHAWLPLTLLVAFTSVVPAAAVGQRGTNWTPRPDAMIKSHSRSSYVGNNVYNRTADHQTVHARLRRGDKVVFDVRMQNDASRADSFSVQGAGNQPGFAVKYTYGAPIHFDVTTSVVNGRWFTGNVAPGDSTYLRLVLKVRPGAVVGSVASWRVLVHSVDEPARVDAIRVRVRVVSG